MRTYSTLALIVFAGLAWLAGTGCKGGPMNKPIKTSPIEKGTDTIQGTRLQLEGHWTLLSLVITNAAGRRANVQATGTLDFDAYANLSIEYRVSESGLKALQGIGVTSPNPVISTKGRAEIDVTGKTIRYVSPDAADRAFDPDLAAARANPFALERIRYYEFAPDGTLKLATRHDDGKEANVSRWKKG
jgi:hypothetical protein